MGKLGNGLADAPLIATPSSLLVLHGEPGSVMSLVPLLLHSPHETATPLSELSELSYRSAQRFLPQGPTRVSSAILTCPLKGLPLDKEPAQLLLLTLLAPPATELPLPVLLLLLLLLLPVLLVVLLLTLPLPVATRTTAFAIPLVVTVVEEEGEAGVMVTVTVLRGGGSFVVSSPLLSFSSFFFFFFLSSCCCCCWCCC